MNLIFWINARRMEWACRLERLAQYLAAQTKKAKQRS